MNRGEIWCADLAEPSGLRAREQEACVDRPAHQQRAAGPGIGNVLWRTGDSGLSRDCVVLVCQVMTVDRHLLTELAGAVPRRALALIDDGLRLALDL